MRVTINNINKSLVDAGIKAELVRGDGYFYFIGDDVSMVEEQGVYGVYHLSALTIEQWVEEVKSKINNH